MSAWIKGVPETGKMLLLWNGRAILGPVSFQTTKDRDIYIGDLVDLSKTVLQIAGAPTHYLVIPKPE